MELRKTTLPDPNRWWRFALSRRFSHRFPWLVLVAGLLVRVLHPSSYWTVVESEYGFIENATVLFLTVTVIGAIAAFRKRHHVPHRWFGPFVLMVLAGTFYFAGEECSWGQHWFGWETPEAVAAVNAQDETNLHNTSSWFNEKPRIILELSILVGLIWAALRDRKRQRSGQNSGAPQDSLTWLLPGRACWSVALATAVVQYPERIGKLFPQATGASHWNFRLAEYQELFFSVYLLTYVCLWLRNIDRQEQPAREQSPAEERQNVLPFPGETETQLRRVAA